MRVGDMGAGTGTGSRRPTTTMRKKRDMKATKVCEHDVRLKGDQKVCITCHGVTGSIYTADRLNEEVHWLLTRVIDQYKASKATFITSVEKNPSEAIRWSAYELLTLHHRAELALSLLEAFDRADTLLAKRELMRDDKTRLVRSLSRYSAFEWDTSTSPFSNQDEKAQRVAEARTLEAIGYIEDRIDQIEKDFALPRVQA